MVVPVASAAGGTISGTIAFPANATDTAGYRIDNVTMLTIYAVDTQTHFANTTNPAADGTYRLTVPADGTYSLWVYPTEIIEWLDNHSEFARYMQYPDSDKRMFLVRVKGDVSNVNINNTSPGTYKEPDSSGFVTSEATATAAPTVVPTAVPTPGFTAVLILLGVIVAMIGLARKKA